MDEKNAAHMLAQQGEEGEIDESSLNWVDRLGLAYCRLNAYQWDELLGPKPEGFDDWPEYAANESPTKHEYIRPWMMAIESIIGKANTSRCWWKFYDKEPESVWVGWYVENEVQNVLAKKRMQRKSFRQRHPDFPLWLSIIALAISIAMPIVRGFLEGKL